MNSNRGLENSRAPNNQIRAAVIARGEDDNSFNLSWQLYVAPSGNLEIMLEDANENNFCYPLNDCVPRGSCTFGDLSVADDVWHHVAASRAADGTLSLYIDGDLRATYTGTGVPSSNNFQVMSIGATFGTIGPPPGGVEPLTWFFSGSIDDPTVWNVALTAAQITEVASVGVDEQSAGLIGYWDFDEGVGQDVTDLSPAGNDGSRGANTAPIARTQPGKPKKEPRVTGQAKGHRRTRADLAMCF